MKTVVIATIGAAAVLALPVTATAAPSKVDKKNAAKECKTELKAIGKKAFGDLYGSKSKKNALGKCVSKHARSEQKQRKKAKRNAAKDCKAERAADPVAFEEKYRTSKGKGKSKSKGKSTGNAFGKCVSLTARSKKKDADKKDKARVNAAKECKAERATDRAAFVEKYGKGRNAFGKCVSATAKAKS